MEVLKAKQGSTQYKTVARFLYDWLKYAMAPSIEERKRGKCIAASVYDNIRRFCWPDCRNLNEQWKAILKLYEQYLTDEKQGISSSSLVNLHLQITTLTHALIGSFIRRHNANIT